MSEQPRAEPAEPAHGVRAVEESGQAIRKYLDDLRVEVELLEATVKELQEEAGHVRGQPSQPSSASINVGGDTGFVLSSDQFEAFPRSLLNSLCTGRWSSLHSLDHEGRIFLDLEPTQFRAILDWAFENAERSERPRLAEASEPHAWGLDLLIRFLGLGEHQAVEPKVKIDPEDGTVCTYPEILCKYSKDYSGDEIRDYCLYSMEQARNVMPCYRPVVFAGVPLREPAQQHLDPLSCLLADHIRAIQDEGAELRQRKAQAQEELESLESERTGLKLLGGRASRLDEESPDIVYFNAAGRLLATSRQTLLHCKGSMLERWFGGDWTVQESEKLGHAVRIDQDSETFASVLQILRFHRIFGPAALPVGQSCRKSKLPLLRQALSYFQLEQVKGSGKGTKGRATASAASWLSPLELQVPREEVYEASSDTNSPVRWEVAVEVAL